MEEGKYYRFWYRDDTKQSRERTIKFLGWKGNSILYENILRKRTESINSSMFLRAEEISEEESRNDLRKNER